METSKALCTIKNLLWCAWAQDPLLYTENSVLYRLIQARLAHPINEAIVLHTSCPLLLRNAMFDLANMDIHDMGLFTRISSTSYESKDVCVDYKSNEWYILIDCQIWSQVERRLVTECLKTLLQSKNVLNGNHLVLLENIECLGETHLHSLKSIICDNLMHTTFICTTRKPHICRSILGSVALVAHCDYNKEYIITRILCDVRPDLSGPKYVKTFVQDYSHDLGLFVATLQHPRPHLYKPHLESYVHERLGLLFSSSFDKVYSLIRDIVCDLMSSYINYVQISPYLLSYISKKYPIFVYDTLSIIANSEKELAESNKIVFAYELSFLKLYDMVANTD